MSRRASTLHFLLMARLCLFALGGQIARAQFSVTQWTHKDGLPSTSIYAIRQTTDGFLWLGTADGLLRYDGYQFERRSLALAGLRSLGEVRTLLSGDDRTLYVGTATGTIVRLQGTQVVSRNLGAPVSNLQHGPDDTVEVTAGRRRFVLSGTTLAPVNPGAQEFPERIAHLSAPQNTLAVTQLHALTSSPVVRVLVGKQGNTWFATADDGLYFRRDASGFKHFSTKNGLSSDRVRDIVEDREGNLWVATDDGLNRLRMDRFAVLTQQDGLRTDTPTHLAAGIGGTLWIGSADGLEAFDGSRSTPVLPKRHIDALTAHEGGPALALSGTELYRATLAGAHHLPSASANLVAGSPAAAWFYSDASGLSFRRAEAIPKQFDLPTFAPAAVTCMAADLSTVVWLGLSNGDVLRQTVMPTQEQQGARTFSVRDGLSGAAVSFLAPQVDGTTWISTGNGLVFFDGSRMLHWDTTTGLPGDRLLWAVPDHNGNLWIGYNFGIAEMSIADLTRYPNSPKRPYQLYDEADGLKGNPTAYSSVPVALTTDGRLWFTMSRGLAVIDPAHIRRNQLQPPVHILTVTAEGKDVPVENTITLPPLNRTLQIAYAGLSLSDPRKVQYRYRLDGFDVTWQDAGPRHNAFYTNLPPGSYRFRVIAANGDGIWNEAGASIAIRIQPALYQTGLFRAACFALTIAVLFLLYRLRLRQSAAKLHYAYEVRMAERSRIAQDLHDNLIQEMLGVGLQLEIADSVMAGHDDAKKPITRALTLVRRAISQGRLALQQMREEPVGLRAIEQTLTDTADARREGSGAQLRFTCTGSMRDLRPEVGEDVLQILREAVRNAVEHGRDTPVHIHTVYTAEHFTVSVGDSGTGLSPSALRSAAPGHYGIMGMRERAARIGANLNLHTSPGTGTCWQLILPAHLAYVQTPDAKALAGPAAMPPARGEHPAQQQP